MKKALNERVLGKQSAGALAFDGVEPTVSEEKFDERGEVNILFDEIFS